MSAVLAVSTAAAMFASVMPGVGAAVPVLSDDVLVAVWLCFAQPIEATISVTAAKTPANEASGWRERMKTSLRLGLRVRAGMERPPDPLDARVGRRSQSSDTIA